MKGHAGEELKARNMPKVILTIATLYRQFKPDFPFDEATLW